MLVALLERTHPVLGLLLSAFVRIVLQAPIPTPPGNRQFIVAFAVPLGTLRTFLDRPPSVFVVLVRLVQRFVRMDKVAWNVPRVRFLGMEAGARLVPTPFGVS